MQDEKAHQVLLTESGHERAEELMTEAKNLGAPYDLVRLVAKSGHLPVPNFSGSFEKRLDTA